MVIGEIKVCIFKTEPPHQYCGVYGKGSRVDSYSTDAGSSPASAQVFGWFRVNKISAVMRIKHIGETLVIFLCAAAFGQLDGKPISDIFCLLRGPIGERMAGQAFGRECYIAEMRDVRFDTWCERRKRKRCVYLKESIELRKQGAL